MRIVLFEIRKLLNWKVISLLLLIGFLFYHLFLRFEYEYFPNGRPALDHFNISKQMISNYGPEMDEKEFENFKLTYEKEVAKAGEYLESHDGFAKEGITTYEKFRSFDRASVPKVDELYNEVFFQNGTDIFWELQAREWIIERYEHFEERTLNDPYNNNEEWKKEYVVSDSRYAILPSFVVENFTNMITMVGILIVLSVMIVTGRIHIIDHKNNAITLQYSTVEGRNLFKKKMIAAMLMATMITTVYLGIFFLMYAQLETSEFFASSLYSFESNYYWLDITFLQYIIVSMIGIYLLSLVAASITTFFSRIVVNYISLIGAQIPVVILFIMMMTEYLITRLFGHQYPVYLSIGTYIGLLLIGGAVLFLRWKKERRIDIV